MVQILGSLARDPFSVPDQGSLSACQGSWPWGLLYDHQPLLTWGKKRKGAMPGRYPWLCSKFTQPSPVH